MGPFANSRASEERRLPVIGYRLSVKTRRKFNIGGGLTDNCQPTTGNRFERRFR
jgi:hypothetical protein